MKILSILIIALSFSQCASTKFEKNLPFKITSATYNNWIGGVPGVSGKIVEIQLDKIVNIDFDSLYFRKRATKIEVREENGSTFLMGHFSTSKKRKNDFVLHSNTKKELKNPHPKTDKIPFELKENEAVISYKNRDKTLYFKIENIEKAKPDLNKKRIQ